MIINILDMFWKWNGRGKRIRDYTWFNYFILTLGIFPKLIVW